MYSLQRSHFCVCRLFFQRFRHIHCYFNNLIRFSTKQASVIRGLIRITGQTVIQCNRRKAGKHFTHLLVNLSWYDIANHSRILIGSCLWSVYRRTLFKTSWFHVALRPSSIKITHDFKSEESTSFSRHLWSIPLSSFLEDSRRVSRIS